MEQLGKSDLQPRRSMARAARRRPSKARSLEWVGPRMVAGRLFKEHQLSYQSPAPKDLL